MVVGALAVAAWWSYASGGLIATLVTVATSDAASIESIRVYFAGWGALAPVIYVLVVTIEVVIAPLPGTLLYAPAGAVFGPGLGGTLSLIGNTLGAMLACLLAQVFGGRIASRLDGSTLGPLMDRLRSRGLVIVALLRVNPLTSSDLVSYAAGLVRVPVWHVAVGTAIGMAPLCYAQSYAAAQIFDRLPRAGLVLVITGVVYLLVVVLVVARALRAPAGQQDARTEHEADHAGDRRQR